MKIPTIQPRAIIKLASGVVAASALLSGGILASTGWLGAQVHTAERALTAHGPTGPNDVVSNETGNPEWVDVSTLTIKGEIDPTTGETVAVTPYHPATIPRGK